MNKRVKVVDKVRDQDIDKFYCLMERLANQLGGRHRLKDCCRHMSWPMRGVYFFFEADETRNVPNADLRVVRVGTTTGRNTVLWDRLGSHKSHRGISVFRDLVGRALVNRCVRRGEVKPTGNHLRQIVSDHIGKMPFLWLKVFEKDGQKVRDRIERNSVALLSGYQQAVNDRPSINWLGNHLGERDRKPREAGLWNSHYVNWQAYKQTFLIDIEERIAQTVPLEPCPECPEPVMGTINRETGI